MSADSNGALFGAAWPNPSGISGEYNLVQRIYKSLLTDPGDDQFDPAWGSGLSAGLRGIPGQQLQAATKAVTTALTKCEADIKAALGASTDPNERLQRLHLDSLEFDFTLASWRASVTVETDANVQLSIQVTA